ncbi:MAG: LysR family transcriptional regulator [Pseudomonas sp. PGPPP1]|uniref:LysR family transcriptional regulator n=1 Tax=Pseudomonas sp. PGPPP1 TaxID=2015553 RepID=UPI000BD5ABF2|nr:LysR family transcriptional regulator [Pseudomonas sp. PGPPP1]OYU07431.1 MAG: LysR family transcriptional regulator [Pseudomonas sp. PGPPP1]
MDYFAALTAFVEAADKNNFSHAAERLGIKASTVSRYIKELEQDLGIALFNRSTRTLHLTEGGETFLLHARNVLNGLEEAKAATSALNMEPRGVLKLNAPPAFCRHHIFPFLRDFFIAHPQIKVEITLEESQVNLIKSGVDLAIRIGVLVDSSLKARKLAEERVVICVSPGFAVQNKEPDSPKALMDGAAILHSHHSDEIILIRAAERVHITLKGNMRTNDLDAQLIAAEQGLGVAFLPDWLVAQSLREGRLVRWLPQWEPQFSQVTSSLWFVYPPKRIVSSKVRCFIDFMIQHIGELPYWQR